MPFIRPEGAGAEAYAFAQIDLEFSDVGRRLALCWFPGCAGVAGASAPDATVAQSLQWRRLESRSGSLHQLVQLLQRADPYRMRTLLSRGEFSVHRFDDYRVRVALAHLIQRGALRMFERPIVPSGLPAAPAAAAEPVVGEGSTLFRYAHAPAAGPVLAPAALASVAPPPMISPPPFATAPDPIQALDQDAQAATLIAAARNGTPFCEECARILASKRSEPLEVA